jgi:hypothetical protein
MPCSARTIVVNSPSCARGYAEAGAELDPLDACISGTPASRPSGLAVRAHVAAEPGGRGLTAISTHAAEQVAVLLHWSTSSITRRSASASAMRTWRARPSKPPRPLAEGLRLISATGAHHTHAKAFEHLARESAAATRVAVSRAALEHVADVAVVLSPTRRRVLTRARTMIELSRSAGSADTSAPEFPVLFSTTMRWASRAFRPSECRK